MVVGVSARVDDDYEVASFSGDNGARSSSPSQEHGGYGRDCEGQRRHTTATIQVVDKNGDCLPRPRLVGVEQELHGLLNSGC